MDREDALDAFALHDASNGDRMAQPPALDGDNHAAELLNALFLTFQNALMNLHRVADLDVGNVFLLLLVFDDLEQSVLHLCSPNSQAHVPLPWALSKFLWFRPL